MYRCGVTHQPNPPETRPSSLGHPVWGATRHTMLANPFALRLPALVPHTFSFYNFKSQTGYADPPQFLPRKERPASDPLQFLQ